MKQEENLPRRRNPVTGAALHTLQPAQRMSTSGERVCKQEAEEAAGLQRQSRSGVTAASTQHFSFLACCLLNCSAGENYSRRPNQETSGPCWSGLCSDPVGGGEWNLPVLLLPDH